MFEYGEGYFEQNEIALEDMRGLMSDAAIALAESMADEDVAADEDEGVNA